MLETVQNFRSLQTESTYNTVRGPPAQVKAGGSTLIGRHDDSIVGLGFQEAAAFTFGRDTYNTGLAETTADITTEGFKPEDKALVAVEAASGSGGTPATKRGRQGGTNRLGAQSGRRGAGGIERGFGSEADEAKEEEAGLESVVLSASMDGVVRAWEMLGKSEKYRMRHPAGVEVTSMLVLPGGSVLVTGKTRATLCDWCYTYEAVAARGPIASFHRHQICRTLPLRSASERVVPKHY